MNKAQGKSDIEVLDGPQLFDISETAKRLSVSEWTVRAWARAGVLETVKLGRRVLVNSQELTRLIQKGTRARVGD